jgi:AcrR family transcriptional regulator
MLKNSDPDQISLRSLAEEIGISHAAIYRHFPDKESLIEMMAIYGFNRLAKTQKSAFHKGNTPEEGFLLVGMAYIQFAIRNPNYYKIMFLSKKKTYSPELKKAMVHSYSVLIFACRQFLSSRGKRNPPRVYALMAWSLVHGYSNLYLETGFPQAEAVSTKRKQVDLMEDVLRSIL